ncbi:hypothetical protein [Saccharothrix variisporea]|uniref:NYN domain-containing protein n=1 Tax=Saccharothrix variisporea TaxID=543527 RepID=A0A495X885_9PSEU|nr:hypothetical protein [Saccharothrix variisporea]RKT69375.1 hypothetical protein DFJ66_2595 [Saccharothrix variisporea]
MPTTGRVLLIDLENVVGTLGKPAALRSKVVALVDAAGLHDHIVAAFAKRPPSSDAIAATLTALGVVPIPVEPGPDAAEEALIAHAVGMHARGCRHFTVCSCDGAFARLADSTDARLDVLVWQGQPIATRLRKVADTIRQVPRPGAGASASAAASGPAAAARNRTQSPPRPSSVLLATMLALFAGAVWVGIGVAVGQRPADVLLRRR